MVRVRWALGVGLLLGSVAAAGAAPAKPQTQWAVLAYLSGESDLRPWVERYAEDLQQAGLEGGVGVAGLLDRSPDEGGPQYWVAGEQGVVRHPLESPVNMGEAACLEEFAAWGTAACPAEHYVLLVVGHGTGLVELAPEGQTPRGGPECGLGLDEGSGGDCLEPAELGLACRAIAQRRGRPVDVLALDACFSGTVETAWEVTGAVEVVCAHPGLLYAPGVGWKRLLGALTADQGMTAEEFGTAYVRAVEAGWSGGAPPPGAAVIAARVSAVPALVRSLRVLSGSLAKGAPAAYAAVTAARGAAPGYGPALEYRDLEGFCAALARELPGPPTGDLAAETERECRAAAIATGGGAGGLAVLLPPNLSALPPGYGTLGFAGESGWGAFLAGYLGYLRGLLSPDQRAGEGVGTSPGGGSGEAPELATAGAA